MVFGLFVLFYGIILVHVYVITIKNHDFFLDKAHQQHCTTVNILPERGIIIDRNGHPLALNKKASAAFITPSTITHEKELITFLQKEFPSALERWQKNPKAHFMYIDRRLTPEQLNLINGAKIHDIFIIEEPHRLYPLPAAAQLIGITDIDNHGLMGIEFLYDHLLQGKSGIICFEKDARSGNFYFKKEVKVPTTPGQSIQLTIDSTLQFLVFQQLKQHIERVGAQEGSVLIVDPNNGHILTMAVYPAFDPNTSGHLTAAHTKNSICTDAYELGSVMKPFVALALLEEGLVDDEELIDCKNSKIAYVQGIRISTWRAHDKLTFSKIMQSSNNIGIATLALRLGPLLHTHYCRLGFGIKTSLKWAGQQSGFVNKPDNWSKSSLISLSFGYEIRATLLQLAQAFCIIARGGTPVSLKLLFEANSALSQKELLYSTQTTEKLIAILEKTVETGTGCKAKIAGYKIWGKTGTANLVIDGHYSTEHNLYTFAGVIQNESYGRLIITFIKDVGRGDAYASTIAAPLFNQVAQIVLINDKMIMNNEKIF